jgi:hypothetical protein
MELTKAAEACITQAHMLRIGAGVHENLCVEHVFFGLLAMARYLDPPLNQPEYREEGRAVRAVLSEHVRSIACASEYLKNDAKHPKTEYADAAAVIGRATEMAEHSGGSLTAAIFARAVLESTTPGVRAACDAFDSACAGEDAKYRDPAPKEAAPEPANRAQKPAVPKSEDSGGPTTSQLGALLALLAMMEDEQHDSLKQSAKKKKGAKGGGRTKLGLFTYRGGVASAAIQYFLFGIMIPFAALCALEYFTGAVTGAPTPFTGFLINAFIVLWLFYLVRGVNQLLGLIGKAFGHFLDLAADCLLLFGLAEAAKLAYGLFATPVWMRVVICIGSLLVLLVGAAMYQHLSDQGDTTKTKIMFQNVEGTPGMIFFRFLTKELIFPALLFSAFWIFSIGVPAWLEKTLYIYGFLWAWNIVFNMWGCMALRYKASRRRHKGQVLVRFLGSVHTLLLLPGMVLYLHWLFRWFPMKTWVVVLMGVYGLLFLIISIVNLKQIKEEC